ncbi:MAG TPA: hypothetical protein ENM97_01205 [Moorella mulderi]|nr:hypothetical protein [Moorella mulderi]
MGIFNLKGQGRIKGCTLVVKDMEVKARGIFRTPPGFLRAGYGSPESGKPLSSPGEMYLSYDLALGIGTPFELRSVEIDPALWPPKVDSLALYNQKTGKWEEKPSGRIKLEGEVKK